MDAATFVLGAFPGIIWSLTRIYVPIECGPQRCSVLSAVETRDYDFVSITTVESFNAEAVGKLLKKISATYPGGKIPLVIDNARYQRSRLVIKMADTLNIELLYLPTDSPNLSLLNVFSVWSKAGAYGTNTPHTPRCFLRTR